MSSIRPRPEPREAVNTAPRVAPTAFSTSGFQPPAPRVSAPIRSNSLRPPGRPASKAPSRLRPANGRSFSRLAWPSRPKSISAWLTALTFSKLALTSACRVWSGRSLRPWWMEHRRPARTPKQHAAISTLQSTWSEPDDQHLALKGRSGHNMQPLSWGITFNRGDGMGRPAAALFDHRMIAGTARGDLLDRLLDRYCGLAADAKTALRLKAMIGSDNNKSLFVACMAATGTRGPDGRTWSFKTVNQVLEQLRSKGLVSDSTSCVAQLL